MQPFDTLWCITTERHFNYVNHKIICIFDVKLIRLFGKGHR